MSSLRIRVGACVLALIGGAFGCAVTTESGEPAAVSGSASSFDPSGKMPKTVLQSSNEWTGVVLTAYDSRVLMRRLQMEVPARNVRRSNGTDGLALAPFDPARAENQNVLVRCGKPQANGVRRTIEVAPAERALPDYVWDQDFQTAPKRDTPFVETTFEGATGHAALLQEICEVWFRNPENRSVTLGDHESARYANKTFGPVPTMTAWVALDFGQDAVTETSRSLGPVLAYTMRPKAIGNQRGSEVTFAILPEEARPTRRVEPTADIEVLPDQTAVLQQLGTGYDPPYAILNQKPATMPSSFGRAVAVKGYKILFRNPAARKALQGLASAPVASFYTSDDGVTVKHVMGITPSCFADAPFAAVVPRWLDVPQATWEVAVEGRDAECALFVGADHPGILNRPERDRGKFLFRSGRMRKWLADEALLQELTRQVETTRRAQGQAVLVDDLLPKVARPTAKRFGGGELFFYDEGWQLLNVMLEGVPGPNGVNALHDPTRANIDVTFGLDAFRVFGGWDAGYLAFEATSQFFGVPNTPPFQPPQE